MNIDEIWKSGQTDDGPLYPPRQNRSTDIPFNRLVYNLHDTGDIYQAVAVDRTVVELIDRKLIPFSENQLIRQEIVLNLMGMNEVFQVTVWVIPIFSDGILVHYVFATDDTNQELLRQHRNPVKPSNYDITSL